MAAVNMPGDTRFRLEVRGYILSQNYGTNQSLIRGELWLIKQGSSTKYAGSPYSSSWSNNIAGNVASNGAFYYDFRAYTDLLLDRRDYWITHDANGYASFGVSGAATVYSMGSASVSENYGVPRIPKVPTAPANTGVDQATTTSLRYTFSGVDNMGAAVDAWQAEAATDDGFTTDVVTSSASSPVTFTGLIPGQNYRFRSRAHNSQGWGAWSTLNAQGRGSTLAALYYSDGANWLPANLQYSDGAQWLPPVLQYSDGTTWLNPLPQ